MLNVKNSYKIDLLLNQKIFQKLIMLPLTNAIRTKISSLNDKIVKNND